MKDLPPEFEEIINIGFVNKSNYFLNKNNISVCYNDNNKYSIFRNNKFIEEVHKSEIIEKLKLYDNE